MPSRRVGLTAVIAVAAALAQAQPPAEFEVASVRQNLLDDRIVTINVGPGGRFATRGYTLVLLMQRAYAVMDWNVTGGPSWIRNDRFDIVAKANVHGDLKETQLRPMLAKLLADRFKLKLHRSSDQIPGYALQVAKGGSKTETRRGRRRGPSGHRPLHQHRHEWPGNLDARSRALLRRQAGRDRGGRDGAHRTV